MELMHNPQVPYNFNLASKNPLLKKRQYTNIAYICIPITIVIIWISIVVRASTDTSSVKEDKYKIYGQLYTVLRFISPTLSPILHQILRENLVAYSMMDLNYITWKCWYIIFGGWFLFCWLVAVRWAPKFFIFSGIFSLCALIGSHVYESYWTTEVYINRINRSDDYGALFIRILDVLSNVRKIIFILIVVLVCLKKTGISYITDLVYKSLRATFFYPSLFLFVFAIFLIQIVVVEITRLIFYSYGTDVDMILKTLSFIAAAYIISFLYYFAKMIIFQAIATYHWTSSHEIKSKTIFICIGKVCRYHLGTIGFSATFVLPLLLALYTAFKTKLNGDSKSGFTETVCKIVFIPCISDYALIQTALNGHGIIDATKKSYYLMVKNSSLSLIFTYVVYAHLTFISTIFYLVYGLIFRLFYDKPDFVMAMLAGIYDTYDTQIYFLLFYLSPILVLAEASLHTIFMCNLEDKEDNEEREQFTSTQTPAAAL